jgi:hypothetical protein
MQFMRVEAEGRVVIASFKEKGMESKIIAEREKQVATKSESGMVNFEFCENS